MTRPRTVLFVPCYNEEGRIGALLERTRHVAGLDEVVVVDQSPSTRSARSNPATITKAFDAIRKRFAATREAKARGWST